MSYRALARTLSLGYHAKDPSLALTPTHGRSLGLWKGIFPIRDGLTPWIVFLLTPYPQPSFQLFSTSYPFF